MRTGPQRLGEILWLGEAIGTRKRQVLGDLLGLQESELKQMRKEGLI